MQGSGFGQVFKTSVNGQIYAQPLVVGTQVIVATENNNVYALNASTGKINWSVSLGKPYAIKDCQNIVPNVGVTSTPVYYPSTRNVYVMANINTGKAVDWRLFGVSVTTGKISFTHGVYGSPSNDSHITFDGLQQLQRPGLLLLNGQIYAAFSSHCDHNPWAGYVSAINPSNGNATLWTDESGATDNQAGIWQSGGGLISDGPNRIILTSGNGVSPAKGPGDKPPGQLAESVIRLQQDSNGNLSAQDFFSPADAPTLDQNDLDYGAAGPAELPVGTTAYKRVIVQDGKIGHIFLLNADNLGGREQGSGSSDNDLYQSQAYGGLWGHPAIFERSTSAIPPSSSGNGDYVFVAGKNDFVREFEVNTNGSGVPRLNDVANSTFQFGYGSGSPVVTSNGTDPNSAVVWLTQDNGGSNSTLVAFPVVPQPAKGGGVKLAEINGLPIGTAANYSIPATAKGMVYVGTGDGHVYGFGVTTGGALHRGAIPSFGSTPVGSATTQAVTATASRTVIVTGVSDTAATATNPFTIGTVTEKSPGGKRVPVTFPVTLRSGDKLRAQVTYAPTAPGGVDGTLSFDTAGQAAPVSVPLVADGTETGLYATVPSLPMLLSLNDGHNVGPDPVGLPNYATDMIVNGGTTPQRISKISQPGGPFKVRYLPKPGTVLLPGQSVTVQFVYRPVKAVTSKSAFSVTGSSGTAAAISLSGSSSPAIEKITAPKQISFGSVPVGHTATRFIHIVNAGNQPATVTSTALTGPFRAAAKVVPGLQVNGGYDLSIPVTFTPAAKGSSNGTYTFNWTDRYGPHSLTIPFNGTGA